MLKICCRWVFSTSLSSTEQEGHTVYDPSSSPNYQAIDGATWDISYADGSGASGTVGTAPVTVGGTEVQGQAVELATQVSDTFVSDTSSNGLLGLAFQSINTVSPTQQTPFFFNAIPSLSSPVFTASLKHDAPGTYDFGEIDTSKYTGDLTYIDVDSSEGFWQFTSPGYQVDGQSYSASSAAIADTGTTLLLMEDDVVTTYYDAVSGSSYDSSQGGYTFDCSATLPSFGVAITDDYYVTVPGDLMTYAPVDSTGESKCSILFSSYL
jgi:Eukaryotic aspartyl protease